MTATLHEIDPRKDRTRRVHEIALKCLELAMRDRDMVGFAFVAWDARGVAHASQCCGYGPIAESLMPAYVHDVLNRHVVADLIGTTVAVPPA